MDRKTAKDPLHENKSRSSTLRRINKIRDGGQKASQTTEELIARVRKDLARNGKFVHDGVTVYYLQHDDRQLLEVRLGHQQFERLLRHVSGLLPTQHLTKDVVCGLALDLLNTAEKVKIHRFAHYTRATNTLYLHNFGTGVYRITAQGIELVQNGDDGVLFTSDPRWEPFALEDETCSSPTLAESLFSGVLFEDGQLHPAESRLLCVVWLLSLLFPELLPTRVHLALIGERGSGKTSVLRSLGLLLFGGQFDVTPVGKDEKDFDAAVTNDPFVVLDNVDQSPTWLNDRLATAATGGTIKRRSYYTTNELVAYPIVARLALTSRTPEFKREDVAERLLPIRITRIGEFRPDEELRSMLLQDRNRLLSLLATIAQAIVMDIKGRPIRRGPGFFRMADVGGFALRVGACVGGDESGAERMQDILKRLTQAQTDFSAEDDPLLGALDAWLAIGGNTDREIATGQLFKEMKQIAAADGLPFPYANVQVFGKALSDREQSLRSAYEMTERSAHGGKKLVKFRAKGDSGDDGDDVSVSSVEGDLSQ
jgi:hypothetical protein